MTNTFKVKKKREYKKKDSPLFFNGNLLHPSNYKDKKGHQLFGVSLSFTSNRRTMTIIRSSISYLYCFTCKKFFKAELSEINISKNRRKSWSNVGKRRNIKSMLRDARI